MKDKTLGELIDDAGSKYFNKVAISIDKDKITYNELKKRATNLAKAFLGIGIRKDDRVCIWMGNCIEWVCCFFGLSKIGAIVVPINTRFKAEEAGYIIQKVKPTTIIVNDIFLNINFMGLIYDLIPEINHCPKGKIESTRYPLLKNIVCLSKSGKKYNGAFNFSELHRSYQQLTDREQSKIQNEIIPDDPALIQFTSGTTGFPKGAVLTNKNFTKLGNYVGKRQELKSDDRFFSAAPFFHCAGTLHALTTPFSYGCTVYSLKRYDLKTVVETISVKKCNVYHGFNIYRDIVYEEKNFTSQFDISCIERAWTTGSPIELQKMENLGIKSICHIYGLTETTGCATMCSPYDTANERINTVGKAYKGIEICIKDRNNNNEVLPVNQKGEICIRGWNVMREYYDNQKETNNIFDEDRWLHTGDLGYLDNKKNLIFLGRIKDIIRVGAENFTPIEVENFLKRNPKILEACVIGVPDKRLDEVCMAVIKLKDGETATQQEIIEFCNDKMANFKIPKYVKFIDTFPLTETNKIKRYEVKKIFAPD